MENTVLKWHPSFESQVRIAFSFLETGWHMSYAGLATEDDGTRDGGLVARYRGEKMRIAIASSDLEKSITISIRLNREQLPRNARHVYFESFLEFISKGLEPSIVPQIYPAMTESQIVNAMAQREALFASLGVSGVLEKLAERLKARLGDVLASDDRVVVDYQKWFESPHKA